MTQTTFEIDDKTAMALEGLKKVYGVTTNAAVLKRALAIAMIAAKEADADNQIHIIRKKNDGTYAEVVVSQSS